MSYMDIRADHYNDPSAELFSRKPKEGGVPHPCPGRTALTSFSSLADQETEPFQSVDVATELADYWTLCQGRELAAVRHCLLVKHVDNMVFRHKVPAKQVADVEARIKALQEALKAGTLSAPVQRKLEEMARGSA